MTAGRCHQARNEDEQRRRHAWWHHQRWRPPLPCGSQACFHHRPSADLRRRQLRPRSERTARPVCRHIAAILARLSHSCSLDHLQSAYVFSNVLYQATDLVSPAFRCGCVLPRTPPLVEAMTALVVIDAALIQKTRRNRVSWCVLSCFAVMQSVAVEAATICGYSAFCKRV
jgi:hypothetical protein